jgi:AraC family transcriptional regulator, regulatory protein of adaptative response / methylated-DNA-[protein]-cysteine methyltransferase
VIANGCSRSRWASWWLFLRVFKLIVASKEAAIPISLEFFMNVDSIESDRWQAIVHRLPSADGTFLYGVKTTGIYCRPTCSSRQPKQTNVLFFDSCTEAETAGFRSCKRCNPRSLSPQQQQNEIITKVCKQIVESDKPLSLDVMAKIAGLSSHHFRR